MAKITLNRSVRDSLLTVALPISLQSLFQASLSVIDEIMIGQIGTDSITGVGLGSKFPGLFLITLAAIGTSASIMISQYYGAESPQGVSRSFVCNGMLALLVTVLFFLPSAFFPEQIMRLYTNDSRIIRMGADYLRLTAIGYFPLLCTTMVSAILRNTGYAGIPMAASIVSVLANTLLNYLLIFGSFGAPRLGINGTAVATTASRMLESLILLAFFFRFRQKGVFGIRFRSVLPRNFLKQTLVIASPIVANEFLWGFGDTVYASVYGHIGTEAAAAMTLTYPVQSLSIGLFTGVSSATAILVGNSLGKEKTDEAYATSRSFLRLGMAGSACFVFILLMFSKIYVNLYNVPETTKQTTAFLLAVFAGFLLIKVSNMILGGGILRSGGNTGYTLLLDVLGTWGIGVPLGLLAGFVLRLPIQWVYFFISIEEAVRLVLGLWIFRSGKWINNITQKSVSGA
jgi:putative efflux protein, MATE family